MPGANADGDNWGSSVAIGDITGDGKAELVVGAKGEWLGDLKNAGDVTVFRGSASGVSRSPESCAFPRTPPAFRASPRPTTSSAPRSGSPITTTTARPTWR
ncbi:FG-GAP repeat protein [Streptomyces sp. NPDC056910]|uniref:FG-GAP repeat protein n=1 Tax=Streptomyces sp. NPDC056910 TaxID=3345964 RepID=UPI0036D009CE